ncbi:sulfite exporter TauE/SafE family protein [Pullulanibacillus sp. KACC 23026]|uniref:sulfite exporter TauE/SafE family protein n=1 Tax=Pullulanibacillus sp. KACC 23026 TaxID=3028315 RepID=UPI0023B18075|nr:sulfite exporter TauE/SafE family protein [Pullulanibacillus sp. KACC 23026]WEG12366.1 sulfite exporter TauE/SafE family protein [Pullulanibacillus sp. KACC 23026]
MSITLIIMIITIVFIGALMRATFGFGEAIVSMPLLTLLPINLHTAISLIGLAGLTVACLCVAAGWRNIDRSSLVLLAISTLLGIPAGLIMVTFAPVSVITVSLGVFLVVYGIYSLVKPTLVKTTRGRLLQNPVWALPFGFSAGVLGSAYNFNGVPVVVYGTMKGWQRDQFQATLQAHFLISGVLVVVGQAIGGLWTKDVFILFGLSLPLIVIATILGTFLHKRIPPHKFERYVFVLIVLLGILLLIKT